MSRERGRKMIAQNKKARHDYHIEDVYEAGLVLTGTEVKSLRAGRASLVDGFATFRDGEMYLHAVQERLAVVHLGEPVDEGGAAGPQRLDLGAGQDQTGLVGVLDVVVVSRLLVLRDDLVPLLLSHTEFSHPLWRPLAPLGHHPRMHRNTRS